ncbi:MAG TPA: tetratricopeptide repeat protein, partial [Verrucomicrobiae bacterium]|nr:tetratricopeptide repeat protein [Verrucomicrobiae bacterium]
MKQNQKRTTAVRGRSPSRVPFWSAWLTIAALAAGGALIALKFAGSRPAPIKSGTAAGGREGISTNASATATRPPETGVVGLDAEFVDADKALEYLNRGNEMLRRGKIDEAAALYAAAVKITPDDEDAHYNLALALAKQGKLDEARKHYEEALRIYPDYSEAHNNLGNLLVGQGRL